jgi:hypothetical protein
LRKRGHDADEVAHFLTQCLFCFFAEDVGLLPGRMFEGLVNNKALTSDKLTQGLTNLFGVMWKGGLYGNDDIPWFNGGLFKTVNVPLLSIMEVTELRNAAALNWSAIDVSIFRHAVRARAGSVQAQPARRALHRPGHHSAHR